mgnify:CR=1 FL=1|jgi:ribosomal protein L21|tara:strand:- start:539 stop:1273 length:735 start_codon:yes stop_codon:yes gene_type:complete
MQKDALRLSKPVVRSIIRKYFERAGTMLISTLAEDPEDATYAEVLAALSGQAAAAFDWNGQNLTETGTIQASTAVWWRENHYNIFALSPGGSGATVIAPDANTLGGFQLDAPGETLYVTHHIPASWSGDSDVEVHAHFEVNVDNTGGNDADTVDLQLVVRMKGEGETAIKTQTLENAVVVGRAAQYKEFMSVFLVDYDDGSNPVGSGDLLALALNLETDTSEVDDIIVNHVMCRYKTKEAESEV